MKCLRNALLTLISLTISIPIAYGQDKNISNKFKSDLNSKLKTSLNAYSFNESLRDGSKNLDDLLNYCAKTGFDAVDITAYYFPIFAGGSKTEPYTRKQVLEWMIKDIKECVAFGKEHGVIVAIQNHHDFIENADQAIEIIKKVNSEWFGLILDTGSFWTGDSYAQIEKCVPYAVNWQIKTKIYMDGKEEKTDLVRLLKIIKQNGYRGYIPLETLEKGDPVPLVDAFLREVEEAIEEVYGEE